MQQRIILVSDGTGETAAQMTKAAMVQFSHQEISLTRFTNVRHESQIEAICQEAAHDKALLIYTIVSPHLRAFLQKRAHDFACVDLLGPLLIGLGSYFGYEPKSIAGLLHDVNESYFDRIAAMEYTIAHDDGKDLTHLESADLVLLGISRTSKTPLSMYLSHQGWRVANIPLIQGFEIPKEVTQLDPRKVIGLTIDATTLTQIRRARIKRLGHPSGEYADPAQVFEEIEYANNLFKGKRWQIFNVSGKALEETAAEIIRLMAARRLAPPYTLERLMAEKG